MAAGPAVAPAGRVPLALGFSFLVVGGGLTPVSLARGPASGSSRQRGGWPRARLRRCAAVGADRRRRYARRRRTGAVAGVWVHRAGRARAGRGSASRWSARRPWPRVRTRSGWPRSPAGQVAQAGVVGGPDPVLAASPAAVPQSRSASWPFLVLVAKQVNRCPSTSVNRSWAPGMRPFLAGEHPHPLRPARQIQQAGELGHPRARRACPSA
jgi:hypothetical protein